MGGFDRMKLGDLMALLKATYTGSIGAEFMHISDADQRQWITELPLKFRHQLEVHSIDRCNKRRRQEDHGSDREDLDDGVLLDIDEAARGIKQERNVAGDEGGDEVKDEKPVPHAEPRNKSEHRAPEQAEDGARGADRSIVHVAEVLHRRLAFVQ